MRGERNNKRRGGGGRVGWWAAVLLELMFCLVNQKHRVVSRTPKREKNVQTKAVSVSLQIFQGLNGSSPHHLLSFLFTTDKYIFPHVVPITQLLDALIDTR